jgi:hypothetical protein
MQRISMPLFMLWLVATAGVAAERKFPYEAVVTVEEEYVRSGSGRTYYPTGKLRRGDRVMVHRHDPGGWVMIAPPAGSFSWIRADYVHRQGDHSGIVIENNAIVRIGSEFNDEHDFYMRELSKGDTVEILGEKTFETDRGPVRMLKIKPPLHEYRWIQGRALSPADTPVRKPVKPGDVAAQPVPAKPPAWEDAQPDPFEKDAAPSRVAAPSSAVEEASISRAEPVRSTDREGDDLRARLAAIDDQFRRMIKDEPSTWSLTGLEQQYRQLEELTELPALRTQIKWRLDAVKKYAKIKEEYDEFLRVTTETKQRDAQLLSLTTAPTAPKPTTTPHADQPVPAARPKKFDGAGIIQRAASPIRGAPRYVLTTPEGRVLAYLQPAPGVDLNPYVGQAMGVVGQRSYRQELQGDLIIVRSLQPVRLKGGT